MSVTQVKTQSIAELAIGTRTLATLDLGTPSLGTFWIIEFVNVNYIGSLTGAIAGLSTLKTATRLVQSNSVLQEFTQPLQSIKEKTSETSNLAVNFQFPQAPLINPTESLLVEIELKRESGTGQYGLEAGKVTMGYTIIQRQRNPRRNLA